jgi:hypothetical protein
MLETPANNCASKTRRWIGMGLPSNSRQDFDLTQHDTVDQSVASNTRVEFPARILVSIASMSSICFN